MSTKEFIKKQVENFSKPLTPEQFIELEAENSLIILEIPLKDYTLTEISRIVESNNAHIISLYIVPISGGKDLLVSLKLNISDLTVVLRSLRDSITTLCTFHERGRSNRYPERDWMN